MSKSFSEQMEALKEKFNTNKPEKFVRKQAGKKRERMREIKVVRCPFCYGKGHRKLYAEDRDGVRYQNGERECDECAGSGEWGQ